MDLHFRPADKLLKLFKMVPTAIMIIFLGALLLPGAETDLFIPSGIKFLCFECNSVFHKYCHSPFSNYVSTCETEGFCAKISVGGAVTRKCLPHCVDGRIAEMTLSCCRGSLCNVGTITFPTTLLITLLPLAVLWSFVFNPLPAA